MTQLIVALRNFANAYKYVFHTPDISNVLPRQSSMKLSNYANWLSLPFVCLWDCIKGVQTFEQLTDCSLLKANIVYAVNDFFQLMTANVCNNLSEYYKK